MTKDSILVIGGGIAGIQASLDLANMGFKVYLIEKRPSIGGRMAQLDKTFPTNDCSMCILAPKMIECANHENIELLTHSELGELTGEAGRFKAKIIKKARFIEEDKCVGCGDCAAVCPVSLPDEHNQRLCMRQATYLPFPQSVPRIYIIDKKDRPPCIFACPARINVQGYVAMVKAGKYKEAIEIIMRDMPLPGVLGRVCVRFCEERCRRSELDEPVSIKELKRFAADQVDILSLPTPEITPREERVAIVGSGPSGLSAAYFLALEGFKSTIFEASEVPGGMLALGIPEFRLPREVLNTEIENIKRFGVEIRTNTPVGRDLPIEDLLNEGYRAVYIAAGAHEGVKLNIPGEDQFENIHQCVPWFRDVNLGNIKETKGKVVIIGGGNAAVDAARICMRLGADEVHIVYRRSREEMPADSLEIEEALHEGVQLHTLVTPKKVIGHNRILKGLECLKNRLGEPDSSGRRMPIPIEGSEFFVSADHIIAAIGQAVDKSFTAEVNEIEFSDYGLLKVNPKTLETTKKGVFAGGDVVTGPRTVIEAIAQGKKAAISISAYLQGKEMPSMEDEESRAFQEKDYKPIDGSEPKIPRAVIPTLDVTERIKNFQESNLAMDEETARREADRCLDCGLCCECFQCVQACKAQAINHEQKEQVLTVNVGAVVLATGFDLYDVAPLTEYGWGRIRNVITAMQFERMICASGPTGGHLKRPSDDREPAKLAFIQCVGSRDIRHKRYCSAVCCMHATKEAILAHEHYPGLRSTIFYIDIRAVGKGFQEYVHRAKSEYSVEYIRARPGRVIENEENQNPIIHYEDTVNREFRTREFDMVILSQALIPAESNITIAKKLNVELDEFGFISTPKELIAPFNTTREGVFGCGFCQSPMDIPDSVVRASAAAAKAAEVLAHYS